MNIVVIGKFYSEGFALHIAETLEALGHSVRRFEPGFQSAQLPGRVGQRIDQVRGAIYASTDSLPQVRAHRMAPLWRDIETRPLDLVLVCHDFLWPREVAQVKRLTQAQVVMWFPDPITNFGRAFFMNAAYDVLFFKDPYLVHAMKDVLRSRVYYLPECFNPLLHWLPDDQLGSDPQYRCDITTAGNQHSWRVAFFKHLNGYDVKLWGNPAPLWMDAGEVSKMHQGRSVYNHDKVRAFRGAKIVLNNMHVGETWGVNVRTFEAAGAGAFQMVDARPGISQLFEPGKELITFGDMVDLKLKLQHWLPREDERREVAAAGCRRAHRDHTYALRLELLLQTLQERAHGFPLPTILERSSP